MQNTEFPATDPMVSVVIPVKNEMENVIPLGREVSATLAGQAWGWECLWVDDGSDDGTLPLLKRLSEEDPHHRFISFGHNSGQSAAFWAGFRESRGDIIATLDGDGQNDPRDLPALIEKVRSGSCDMANGYRQERQDTAVRKIASRVANGFRNAVTGKTVRDVGCSTRAFRRECLEALVPFRGMHRFMPTLVQMAGFTLGEEAVNHRPRRGGRSKYGINNRLWVGLADTFGIYWLRKRAFPFHIGTEGSKGREPGHE